MNFIFHTDTLRFTYYDIVNHMKQIYEITDLVDRKKIIKLIKQFGFDKFDFYISYEDEDVYGYTIDSKEHINDITKDEFNFFIKMGRHEYANEAEERDIWDEHREQKEKVNGN